jgi:predicted ATPase
MIIELHNFGPIERFTFDTEKRMHFIFGENNVGKSYAITAVYLILKNWEKSFSNFNTNDNHLLGIHKKLKTLKPEIDISDEINDTVYESLYDSLFMDNLHKSFMNSFTSINELSNKYSRKKFIINILTDDIRITISNENNTLSITEIQFPNKILLEKLDDEYSNYIYKEIVVHAANNEKRISKFISAILNEIIFNEAISKIYYLPASRSGIYNGLSAWSAILVQLTQFRSQNKDTKFEIPTLTEPISDYFLNLTNIEKKAYSTQFSKFAKRIEDEIIKGKINFDKGNRKLYYEPANLDLSLELSQASSMISEIAPIIAHLKFIFDDEENVKNGRNYIFIEEPEAHLHPKVQVALIQLFAEMAKEGLHVVMTSHSNYMFNKLSNMVLAKEIAPETISVGLMKLGEKGSYIDENAMHIDEDGIDDDNFSETAEALYTERLKLYEQNPS